MSQSDLPTSPIPPPRKSIEELAREQGVTICPVEDLIGDFWPEEQTADEFIAFIREGRRESERPRDFGDRT